MVSQGTELLLFYKGSVSQKSVIELPAIDAPWLRGDGLTESIRTSHGKVFHLIRHIKRLEESIRELLFALPAEGELESACQEIILFLPKVALGTLRISYYSNGEFFITHKENHLNDEPLMVALSPFPRYSLAPVLRHKTVSYAENCYGLRLAAEIGCNEVLFVNEEGNLTESALANVVVEIGGELVTPSIESGILPGVVRSLILEWDLGVKEREVHQSEFDLITGVALLSSIRGIRAATSFAGRPLANSPEIRNLAAVFEQRSLDNPAY